MRNFMFSILLAVLMVPSQGLVPASNIGTSSTDQKYENYLISEHKKVILDDVFDITRDSNFVQLLYENHVLNDYHSLVKLDSIARELDVRAGWLLMTFHRETGGTYSTAIQNPKSDAVGIIQWLPSTAKYLGTSIDSLKTMSFIEQLTFVKKYVDGLGIAHRINSYEDTYLAVFHPAAVGKSNNYVIGLKPKSDTCLTNPNLDSLLRIKYIRYLQNSGMDKDKDGRLTVKDVKVFATTFS